MKNSKASKTPRQLETPPKDVSGASTTTHTPATPESLGYLPPKRGPHSSSRKYVELPITPRPRPRTSGKENSDDPALPVLESVASGETGSRPTGPKVREARLRYAGYTGSDDPRIPKFTRYSIHTPTHAPEGENHY